MQVTRTLAYAVQSMVELAIAPPDCPVPCRTLAKGGAMPKRYLFQILRNLVARGILKSVPGVTGGFLLARHADSITLFDVVEALGNPFEPYVPDDAGLSQALRDQLLTRMARISASLCRELGNVTIADLANQQTSHGRVEPQTLPRFDTVATLQRSSSTGEFR